MTLQQKNPKSLSPCSGGGSLKNIKNRSKWPFCPPPAPLSGGPGSAGHTLSVAFQRPVLMDVGSQSAQTAAPPRRSRAKGSAQGGFSGKILSATELCTSATSAGPRTAVQNSVTQAQAQGACATRCACAMCCMSFRPRHPCAVGTGGSDRIRPNSPNVHNFPRLKTKRHG